MATTADIVDFVEEGALDANHGKGKQQTSACDNQFSFLSMIKVVPI